MRLTKTLEKLGYLARDPHTGRLRLGPSMLKLSYVNSPHNELVRLAVPHMRRLSEVTSQPVDLTVQIDRRSLMTLYDVAPRFLRPQAPIGGSLTPSLRRRHINLHAFGPQESWDEVIVEVKRPH